MLDWLPPPPPKELYIGVGSDKWPSRMVLQKDIFKRGPQELLCISVSNCIHPRLLRVKKMVWEGLQIPLCVCLCV